MGGDTVAKKKKERLAAVSDSTSINVSDDSSLSSTVKSSSSSKSGRGCSGCKGC